MPPKKQNKYGNLPPVMQRQGAGSRLIFVAIILLVAVFFVIDPMNWFDFSRVTQQEVNDSNGTDIVGIVREGDY